MPKRYVKIPESVVFKTATKEPINGLGPLSLKGFVQSLLLNPVFSSTYPGVRSAIAIEEAFDDETARMAVLSEEDWAKLKDAAENPKRVSLTEAGSGTQTGYGYHPALTRQLIPLIEAIVKAPDKEPEDADREGQAPVVAVTG